MKPQIISKDGKPEYAVVPYNDYQKLLANAEMLVDLVAYDGAKRALASGEEELIPAVVVYRLLDGDNPIRVWREFRGLTSAQLATACGVSAAAISQLETGKRHPSVALLKKLAAVADCEQKPILGERHAGEGAACRHLDLSPAYSIVGRNEDVPALADGYEAAARLLDV
jgi:transcriptional regulator with XRE-family HTH domain